MFWAPNLMKTVCHWFLISADFLDREVDVEFEVELHVDLTLHFMGYKIWLLPNLK